MRCDGKDGERGGELLEDMVLVSSPSPTHFIDNSLNVAIGEVRLAWQ